jgi:hypothetical protein
MPNATAEKKAGKAARKGKAGLPARVAGNGQPRPMTPAGIRTTITALGAGAYEIYEELKVMFHQEEETKLSFWWNVGKKFLSIKNQWEEVGLNTFCAALRKNPKEVRMAMRAAARWTEEEIVAIVEEAQKNDASVTWSHIRSALASNDAVGEKYLALVQKERMGAEEMVARIKAERRLKEGKKGKTGGRPFRLSTTFSGLYRDSLKEDAHFKRFCDQLEARLPAAIGKIDEERFNAELLTQVRVMREQCDGALRAAQRRAEELIGFERRIEQKLGFQPETAPGDTAATPAGGADAVAAPRRKTVRKPPSAARKKE